MNQGPNSAGKSSFELIEPEVVFGILALKPGDIAVDLGCGDGRYALAMAAQVYPEGKVFGLDLWEEGLAALQVAAEDRRLENIRTLKADVTRPIPLPDRSADLVLLATVLHDFVAAGTVAAAGVLSEAKRLLKPEGRLAVVEFQKNDAPPGPPREIRLTPEELIALAGTFDFIPLQSMVVGPACYMSLFRKA